MSSPMRCDHHLIGGDLLVDQDPPGGVLREMATQGHSRSFILQSVTGQQRVAYRHIILLALSLKFPKK